MAAANTLLTLVAQLRNATSHPDPGALFREVCNELRDFEAAAQTHGEAPNSVRAARFMLCSVIDETVLNTPWGSRSEWMRQTLLSTFHNENWGGEKVFELIDRLMHDPARHLNLLELAYVCICLGFQGKYRQDRERGRASLKEVEATLYETIRRHRGSFERNLSPHWRGERGPRMRLARYLPLWVVAVIAAGVTVFAYGGFRIALSNASEGVFTEIVSLTGDIAPLIDRPYEIRNRVDLRPFLREEIDAGLVQVTDVSDGQRVTLAGDGFFDSGSAQIRESQVPTLIAIGEALNEVSGDVEVIGHTDNVPVSGSARYPTNLVLSEARATAVLDILATRAPAGRLVARGMGAADPVIDNTTSANRARNRRVEIKLLAEAGRL